MLYPIISYGDGTEITASKMTKEGKVRLYIEKFDKCRDSFINIEIIIPNARIVSNNGYSEENLEDFLKKISAIENDIIEYVKEKEKNIA